MLSSITKCQCSLHLDPNNFLPVILSVPLSHHVLPIEHCAEARHSYGTHFAFATYAPPVHRVNLD